MLVATLPERAGLGLDDLVLSPTTATAPVVSTVFSAAWPRCRTPSDRVHSRYRRTVADLPCQDRVVTLRWVVRRFRCQQADRPQAIFCERLPDLLRVHAGSTTPLRNAHQSIGFALGGEDVLERHAAVVDAALPATDTLTTPVLIAAVPGTVTARAPVAPSPPRPPIEAHPEAQ